MSILLDAASAYTPGNGRRVDIARATVRANAETDLRLMIWGPLRPGEARSIVTYAVSANSTSKKRVRASRAVRANSTSGNLLPSRQYEGGEEVERVLASLTQAREPRGSRKRLIVPHLKKYATEPMAVRVNRHLLKLTTKALNDAVLARASLPRAEIITEALEAYVWSECRDVILSWAPGDPAPSAKTRRAYLDPDRVEELCAGVVEYLSDTWSPVWIRGKQAQGRKGRRFQKDRPMYSDAQLDRLAKLPHLTVPGQSVELGRVS